MSSSSSGLAALLAAVACVSPSDPCSSSPHTDQKKKGMRNEVDSEPQVERKTSGAAPPELSTSAAAFRVCQVDAPTECGDAKALVAAVLRHATIIPPDTESSEFGSRLWRVVDPAVTISWNILDGYRWTPAHFRDGVLEGLRAPPAILPLLAEPVKALVVVAIQASNLKHKHVKVPCSLLFLFLFC
jgi:hypothetical protein